MRVDFHFSDFAHLSMKDSQKSIRVRDAIPINIYDDTLNVIRDTL